MEMFTKGDIQSFKKDLKGQKKVLEQFKLSGEEATLKKQYIHICTADSSELKTANLGESCVDFKQLAKILDISEDDVEEWVIEAMRGEIIDAKIDQVNQKVTIKSTMLRG
mmetsp:Transcript_11460/g.19394  ORF Transcript_11460/g.19394 Transcript_11460/m.19394 type:complete len:110 (+) Transcript_11460:925-1254(+)